jgi:hypothetical protein
MEIPIFSRASILEEGCAMLVFEHFSCKLEAHSNGVSGVPAPAALTE